MERYKVLVIEDDEAARRQLTKVIQKEGFEVITAQDGQNGLEIFEKEKPEIIITDLKMPKIDGIEVMHRAKRLSPNVQIVLITAYGEADTAIMVLKEGVLDYLKKPIDLEQLSVALGRAKEKIAEYKKVHPFPSLLLAEDEEKTRDRLARVLEKEGWQVFRAGDGQEAVDIFQERKIDIVLLDIKMPRKDGLTTLHELRGISADFEAMILTGYGDESSAIQAMRDGAINFLRKPIDLEELVIAVKRAIEHLNIVRNLKYRTRELELSKQLIAKITKEKEIIIDVRNHARKSALEFAQQLIDSLPMGIVAVDRDMKLCYMNRHLAEKVKIRPQQALDEEFLKNLSKVGIQGLSYESLAAINKLFESPPGTIETIRIGEYAYLILLSMMVVTEEKTERVVVLAMRGERK